MASFFVGELDRRCPPKRLLLTLHQQRQRTCYKPIKLTTAKVATIPHRPVRHRSVPARARPYHMIWLLIWCGQKIISETNSRWAQLEPSTRDFAARRGGLQERDSRSSKPPICAQFCEPTDVSGCPAPGGVSAGRTGSPPDCRGISRSCFV